MSLPSNIPELAVPQTAPADAQEFARCLENAADLVQRFAAQNAPAALNALLAATDGVPGADAERALALAQGVTRQAETLHGEVERFLALARPR
ncbi:MAG: hypothetical protein ACE5GS_11995 [Kiloniellaceae bacterium]